jgi:hypothetical protein
MKVRFLESADRDLNDAYSFYEKQRDGLGAYFFEQIIPQLDQLPITAGVHRRFTGYHRYLCKTFPFAVYYKVEDDVILVRRVLDCRQDPSRIGRALED